jgi:diaminopimelate decarboxylase
MKLGITYNATSLHQLETYGRAFPGTSVSVRFNVGIGSGHTRSVSVAGPTSSFGVWHEQSGEVQRLLTRHDLTLTTVHSHIGCGNEPEIYTRAAQKTLELVGQFPTVTRLNLGGGFKVARMPHEQATDLQELGAAVSRLLTGFHDRTGRKLHLEIEPGTMLTASAGTLLTRVQDIASTGSRGYTFLKLDTGMNDILRPALHASQHPIVILADSIGEQADYVVVGHNCESTDLLTPSPSDSEVPLPRRLPKAAIGDLVAIEGVGAYCSALRAIGYNSFSSPNEVLVTASGEPKLINRSLDIADYTASEIYA